MARPKKATVDYFPHYVASGKTIYVLESEFGNDGYAFWFKLLELLGCTEQHVYDCNNSAMWRFMLAKTRVGEDAANKILSTLAELQAIDHSMWQEKRVIWVQNFVDNVADVYKRRGLPLPQKPSFCDHKLQVDSVIANINSPELSNCAQSVSINAQSKVKETKSKETIVRENNVSDDFLSFWNAYPRKVAKGKTLVCWNARVRGGVDTGYMITAAKRYAIACQVFNTEEQYLGFFHDW